LLEFKFEYQENVEDARKLEEAREDGERSNGLLNSVFGIARGFMCQIAREVLSPRYPETHAKSSATVLNPVGYP
jgi:hypothetical protein